MKIRSNWLIVGMLTLIAGLLLVQLAGTATWAQVSSASAGDTKTLVVAGQITRDTYGLYLVDPENRTIAVYQWVPGGAAAGKLHLLACRTYTFDRQLDDFNTEPSPREIKSLVEQHKRLDGATTQP